MQKIHACISEFMVKNKNLQLFLLRGNVWGICWGKFGEICKFEI